jgi:alanyl aminopeptidase
MMRRLSFALVLAASCAAEPLVPPPPPPAPTARAEAPRPPALRLPRTAAPLRYAATLTFVSPFETFSGAVDIDLSFTEPSSLLWLGATALTVSEARLESGGKSMAARVVPGGDDFIGFAFDEPAPAGPARLHVVYRGEISAKDDRGVFKEEEGGGTMVFSQFENTDARRAFPCFDEPSFKVPWQLTLQVSEGDTALSNTPAVSETRLAGGIKAVRFAETRPLPSYLVAFAVGPFDLVPAGLAGQKKTPVRIAVPRGQASRARYAVETTGPLLEQLEAFFGTPYPYEKLDVIAVPNLVSFGAMENVGLVTFFAQGMLAAPAEETLAFRQRYADIITHEMAHQWFGDLVTMAWWDDVWLNEAFATWMEGKILDRWKPEWRWDVVRTRDIGRAMAGDSLVSARRIRQAIESADDIQNAFDEITYTKGATVIEMFESYLGPERFRKGVKRYLADHAHGNATATDFLAAVSAEAGRDVGPAFSSFLDQPGVPVVDVELSCPKGKKGPASIALRQERYLPAGSQGIAAQTWQIPVCVRHGAGKSDGRVCTLLTERSASIPLPESAGCPEWVLPNAGGAGYYHARLGGQALDALLRGGKQRLTVPERIGVVRDMGALVSSGKLPVADVFARLPAVLEDPSAQVVRSALDLAMVIREPMIPAKLRPSFARFVEKTFGARARALGWRSKPGEDAQDRLLRPALVPVVADRGDDRALIAEAAALGRRWLDDPSAVEADMIDPVLHIAAAHGDRALFDRLRAELKKASDGNRRQHLVRGLAGFRDPSIVRDALAILLSDELDPRSSLDLFFQDERMVDSVYAFVEQHFDVLKGRIPGELRGLLPIFATPFCDEAHRAQVASFFKDRVTELPGGPRNLAKTLERIALCGAIQRAQGESLATFLKKY